MPDPNRSGFSSASSKNRNLASGVFLRAIALRPAALSAPGSARGWGAPNRNRGCRPRLAVIGCAASAAVASVAVCRKGRAIGRRERAEGS